MYLMVLASTNRLGYGEVSCCSHWTTSRYAKLFEHQGLLWATRDDDDKEGSPSIAALPRDSSEGSENDW